MTRAAFEANMEEADELGAVLQDLLTALERYGMRVRVDAVLWKDNSSEVRGFVEFLQRFVASALRRQLGPGKTDCAEREEGRAVAGPPRGGRVVTA